MRREGIAALLLAALLGGALLNLVCLDRLIREIETELAQAEDYAARREYDAAEAALRRAADRWVGAKAYTHIFIRHAEIDAVSEAFFECKSMLAEENAEGIPSAFEKLCYHLNSVDEMEHIRLGSVL